MENPLSLSYQYSEVKYVENNEDLIFIIEDSDEASRLTKQIFIGHLVAMFAFATICLIIPSWLFVIANILLSPKSGFVHFRCSKDNLVVSRHYIRSGSEKLLVPLPVSLGPELLGRESQNLQSRFPILILNLWNGMDLNLN